MEDNLGAAGRLREAGEGAATIGKVLAEVPRLLTGAERAVTAFAEMARSGVRLDDDTVAPPRRRKRPPLTLAHAGLVDRRVGPCRARGTPYSRLLSD